MSKVIGGPVTQEERSATRAVDLYKGMDCGRFDPEKSDHIHGRSAAAPLLFSAGRGLDTRQFCQTCGLRWAWCKCAAALRADGEALALELGSPYDPHILDKFTEAVCR